MQRECLSSRLSLHDTTHIFCALNFFLFSVSYFRGAAELHPQANPSQAELLKKKFKDKSSNLKQERKKAVLDKYGGAKYLDGNDGLADSQLQEQTSKRTAADEEAASGEAERKRKIRFGTSTQMQEYTLDGRVVQPGQASKQQQQLRKKSLVPVKSKYNEDVFSNGHTTVFGSYFHKGAFSWGYADDHSLLRNSYCTGLNGRLANDEANALQYGDGREGSAQLAQLRQVIGGNAASSFSGKTSKLDGKTPVASASSKMYGEANQFAKLDQDKVQAALEKQENEDAASDRKRGYNSIKASDIDVTEEELEAYRLKKSRGEDDPMAKLSASAGLLEYKK
jgi:pre-mRNA-processing factor SLU7